ncbi:MAG TPA: tetratricopeptide repeat protein [Steroidobacteraceae bacterium]|nr:tetratricopeptide repeat protein [Steroidobacteraceae bacterium]
MSARGPDGPTLPPTLGASRAGALAGTLLAGALAAGCAHRPPSQPTTIGDLSARVQVPVQSGALPAPDPAAAMSNYRQFLQLQNTDPTLRAEAMRRLADLNLQSVELDHLTAAMAKSDPHGVEAIRLYTTLLQAFPHYAHDDAVLYQLARAYDITGQSTLALATLERIVANYPRFPDIGEVQFRRGELLFSAQRYPSAQQAYEAVLALGPGGSAFYPQSLYKRAWSQFKQGLNQQCLTSFAQLLDYTLLGPHAGAGTRAADLQTLRRADRDLVDDTLRVMSISFSYLNGPGSIDALVAARGPRPYTWLLYRSLGDLYVSKQRYQDAAAAYRAFVARDPIDEHAPALSMAAIQAYRKGGFPDLMLQGKLEYVQRYGFSTPFWQGRQHSAYPQVVDELKVNLKDVAEYYHVVAQRSHSDADYAAAAHWYRAYLASFPEEPDSAATNYLLADALFESHQYLAAASEYERTAYDYPPHKQAAAAGYAALVAYQKYEDALPPAARGAVHLRAIDSDLKFAQTFPNNPAAGTVLTHAAQDLFTAGDQARALQAARLLLARPGVDGAQQRIGWSIVGQVSFNQGDYAGAESAFTRALALAGRADPQHADLTERLAAAVYKQGDAQRRAGNSQAAAEDFLRVARVAPGSKIVETAQYDAAASLIDAQQWRRAIPILEALRRADPRGQYSAGIASKLAVAYAAAGQAGAAAAEFERIAATPGQDPAVVREALTRAADLYQKSGDTALAVTMLERLVQQFPTPIPDAIEVRQRLVDLASGAGDTQRALYWQRQIVLADAQAGPARTDRTRYLAAQADLALAAPLRDRFRAIQLVAPLRRSLEAKKLALQAAVQAYREVAAYQVAQTTTAATYETAELYHRLAQDLLASERPRHLSAEALEQYESLLEDQAYPFEEQAIAIHELNVKRAQDGIYDDWVRNSYAQLAGLLPARYGKTELVATWIAALSAPARPPAPAVPPPTAPANAAAPGASVATSAPAAAAPTGKRARRTGHAAQGSAVSAAAAAATPPAPPAVPPPSAAALADFQRVTDLANAGRDTDAQLELEQFDLRYPGYAIPSIDLGLLARRDGHLDASEAALRRATQLDGASAVAWTELGVTLRMQGKFPQAQAAYERAIAAEPGYAPAHRNLGVLLDLYRGDPVAALPQFERYQALTGEGKPVSTWLADLRQRTGVKRAAPSAGAPAAGSAAGPGAAPGTASGAAAGAVSGSAAAKATSSPSSTKSDTASVAAR